MRLLHTSDWHLGQALHSYDRSYEHQQFLDWLLGTLEAERIDTLLIAGDIFDTANPSSSAQKQLYRFLQQARKRCPALDIVVIAGNHDSPGRLEAPGPLLEDHGITVIGHVLRDGDGAIDLDRLLVPLHDAAGTVAAWCLAVPFLRPGDLPRLEAASGLDPYLEGIALLYQQAYARAAERRAPGQHIVAMGYCHQVLRIDLAEGEETLVTPIAVPRAVELLRVPATPQPLDAVLLALAELALENLPPERQPFLEVRVLLDAPEPGLRARIEQVLADKPVRLAKIEPTRKVTQAAPSAPALSLKQLAQLQPDDIFKRLYAQRYGDEAPEDQLAAFAELMLPGAGEQA